MVPAGMRWDEIDLLAPDAYGDPSVSKTIRYSAVSRTASPSRRRLSRNRGVLEELEKAHVYIEQLNAALKNQQKQIDALRAEMEALKKE